MGRVKFNNSEVTLRPGESVNFESTDVENVSKFIQEKLAKMPVCAILEDSVI
jgi:plastocyanin